MARRPRKKVAKRLKKRRSVPRQEGRPPLPFAKRHHNLPARFTSFIGREIEIGEIKRLLATTRLLTLTGAGGCGKTRLALQTAGDVLDQFADGVWIVDLAPLANPLRVSQAVAATLGIAEQPRRNTLDALIDFLSAKKLLLVLDNCEHLLPSVAGVVHVLLRECPHLRILATSREPLNLEGEIRWTVPGLSLPDPRTVSTKDGVMKSDAVRLFVDRAAAHAAFVLTDGNAAATAELCRQLDGIPLAIEMAAAWVRMLSVEDILGRLADRFRLLRSDNRGVTPRHQTLKTAMDWSYELLPEPERRLLSRLSVFAGGWTLDAAEAVCSDESVSRSAVLSLLTHLVDKSLVVAETGGGGARYHLLETIRQYGRDRLPETGDAADLQTRHRDWYLNLAEHGQRALRGPEQTAWLARLETEHDNLRAALAWSKLDRDKTDALLRLAAALHEFWFVRGYYTEGREWLDDALSSSRTPPTAATAWALSAAGVFAMRQSDAEGEALLQRGLALFQTLQDNGGAAYALHHLAHVGEGKGDHNGAVKTLEQSVALYRQAGDDWGVGWSLHCLGAAIDALGDHSRATTVLEESLTLCRSVGNKFTTAFALGNLGAIATSQGAHDRAAALLEEGLMIAQQIEAKATIAWAQCGLAHAALARGDHERALTLFCDSLVLLRELGNDRGAVERLASLAGAFAARGDYIKAARLFGAADALPKGHGSLFWPSDPADLNRRRAAARAALGEKSFDAFMAEGRTMTLRQAAEYALAPADARRPRGPESISATSRGRPGLLAPRERQVARLIAEGKTNRGIATQLSISEGTVEAHVQHILNKLGFNSRAQVAAWIAGHATEETHPRVE